MVNKEANDGAPQGLGGPRAMDRVLRLFEVLSSQSEGLSLAELSVEVEAPKSTLRNSLGPLVLDGFLMLQGARYRLGPRAFRLAADMIAGWSLNSNVRPFMNDLAAKTGETVALSLLDRDGHRSVFVEVVESAPGVKFSIQPGRSVELYAGASGRVLLAFQSEEYKKHYLSTAKFERLTKNTTVDPKILRQQLDQIRSTGFWVNLGEAMSDVAVIAAPIFAPDKSIRAALSVGGPLHRLESRVDEIVELVVAAAKAASGEAVSALGPMNEGV